jgi:hypothetical protein
MSCMATTTYTMVVKLRYKVVASLVMWLFREATTSSSLLALSPPRHKNLTWHCLGRPMKP